MKDFLVVYDYGTGGVWGIAKAASEAEITRRFPELKVVHDWPDWMADEVLRKTRHVSSFVVDDETSYPAWLRAR